MDLDEALALRLALGRGGQLGLAEDLRGGALTGGLLGPSGLATSVGLDLHLHLGALSRVEHRTTRQVVITAKLGLALQAPEPKRQSQSQSQNSGPAIRPT